MMSGPVLLWTSCTCVVLSLSLWACFGKYINLTVPSIDHDFGSVMVYSVVPDMPDTKAGHCRADA